MNGFALLAASAVMGVDYGWEPDANGQLEYIIQIEPMTLIALREGHDIVSQLDPYVRYVRRFRIHVGTEAVPRRGSPPREPGPAASPQASPGVEYGWKALDQGQIEFVVQVSPDRLEKLHGDEDISGQMPSGLGDIVRIRIQSKTEATPNEEPAAGADGVSTAGATDAEQPAPPISAPPLVQPPHEWSQLLAIAPPDVTGAWTAGPETRENMTTRPEHNAVPRESNAAARDVRSDSIYRSLTDMPKDDLLRRDTRRDVTPLSSLPVPGIGTSQASEAFQPRTIDRGTSIYDQRAQGWGPPGRDADTTAGAPRRLDTGQPTAPPIAYSSDPRAEFPPFGSQPTTSPTSPWSSDGTPASAPQTLADRNHTRVSDSGAVENDGHYFGVPDSLASALGYEPWPNRTVSYNVEVTPSPAPQDFWSSLSETANDRSLDYLREGDKPWWPLTLAMLALFASIGGNLYMGWIVAGTYRKYLDLADDLDDGDRRGPAPDDPEEDSWSPRRMRRERRTVDA